MQNANPHACTISDALNSVKPYALDLYAHECVSHDDVSH